MKEETAVAIMMGNLKGSKKKPTNLLEFAEACKELKAKWGFKEMSKFFKVSEYMLRQIDKINELDNSKIQQLIKKGDLGIDACYQLSKIQKPQRLRVANIIKNMKSEEVRRFVYFIVKNPKISIEECKKLLEREKPEEIKLLVLPLDSQIFKKIESNAKHSRLKVTDYVLKILKEKTNGK